MPNSRYIALLEAPEDFDEDEFDYGNPFDDIESKDLCLCCMRRVELNSLRKSPTSSDLYAGCEDEMVCEDCEKQRSREIEARERFTDMHRRNEDKHWYEVTSQDELIDKNRGFLPHQKEAKYDRDGKLKE